MKYSQMSGVEMELSQITLGTWVFSGPTWGDVKEAECIDAVHAALDCGINVIDTAPIYGYGQAETIVGKALTGKRDQVFLATKCGLIGQGKQIRNNLKPDSIRQELNQSLVRLQTDCVDLYQCHWPDPQTPLEETFGCLGDLQAEGKIRHVGISNFPLALLKEVVALKPDVRFLQSPLSLLERGLAEDILPFCNDKDIGVLAYGSLGGGILSGKYTQAKQFPKDDARSFFYKYYTGDGFNRVRGFLDKISSLKRPLNQVAINWVRQQSGVVSVLTGCRTPDQVRQNVQALEWDLSSGEMAFINNAVEEFGL